MDYTDFINYYEPLKRVEMEECAMPSLDWYKDKCEVFINEQKTIMNGVVLDLISQYTKKTVTLENFDEVRQELLQDGIKFESTTCYTVDDYWQTTIQLTKEKKDTPKRILLTKVIRTKIDMRFD